LFYCCRAEQSLPLQILCDKSHRYKKFWRRRTEVVALTPFFVEYKISAILVQLNRRPDYGSGISFQPGYYAEKWRRIRRLYKEGYKFNHLAKKWEKH